VHRKPCSSYTSAWELPSALRPSSLCKVCLSVCLCLSLQHRPCRSQCPPAVPAVMCAVSGLVMQQRLYSVKTGGCATIPYLACSCIEDFHPGQFAYAYPYFVCKRRERDETRNEEKCRGAKRKRQQSKPTTTATTLYSQSNLSHAESK